MPHPPHWTCPQTKDELVGLAVPLARPGVTEVDFGDSTNAELRRWRVIDEDLRDHTHASRMIPSAAQTAVPNLRLLRARDATEGFTLLGIAHVLERRSDRQLVLDRGYIAPQVRIDATGQLSSERRSVAWAAAPARGGRWPVAWDNWAMAYRSSPTS